MLIHGLAEHSGRYGHVAEALVSKGFAVCALDLRGHGRSQGARVYAHRYSEFMDDLSRFRNDITARFTGVPLVVLGHSMGANLALGHVLERQEGLAGLALSGAALKAGSDLKPIQLKILKLIAKVAPKARVQKLTAASISRDPAVVAAYQADPLVFTGKVTAGLGAAVIGAMASFPSRYGQLRLPVVVMHGTEDRLTSIEGSYELAAGAVHATVTTHFYDGLYHEIFNEPERDAVLADLTNWLTELA